MGHERISRTHELVAGGPLKPLDRLLRQWRFSQARPFVSAGDRVLDVGSSDGALFRYLSDRLRFGVGVDPALRQAVEAPRFRLVPGGFPEAVPEGETFDVITMLAVIEHLPPEHLGEAASASARLLRPRGRVVITVPSPVVDSILHWLLKLRLVAGIGVHEHHAFDPEEVPAIFGAAGLRLFRRYRFQFGLNNVFVFVRP